jgi:hypothetical protein
MADYCEHGNKIFGSIKQRLAWPTEQLSASQQGFWSKDLDTVANKVTADVFSLRKKD